MKKLLLLLIVLAGLGFLAYHMGWFKVSSETQGDKTKITVTVDKAKIKQGEAKAAEKIRDLKQTAEEKLAPITKPATE